jgi:hydroxylysine kinase
MVEQDLDFNCEYILPQLSGRHSQIIHNDGNIYNLIIDPNNPGKVSGLVDFGDMMHAPLTFVLAVSAGSLTLLIIYNQPVM